MKSEFFCKACMATHPAKMLWEGSDPSRPQCVDSVKKIEANKLKSEAKELKAEARKVNVDEVMERRRMARKAIEIHNERKALKLETDYDIGWYL